MTSWSPITRLLSTSLRVYRRARDDNRNAHVDVSYRKQGETQWKLGMPLLRLQGERIYQQGSWDVVSPNMFAGSVLFLSPGTTYEVKVTLTDPDGEVIRPMRLGRRGSGFL